MKSTAVEINAHLLIKSDDEQIEGRIFPVDPNAYQTTSTRTKAHWTRWNREETRSCGMDLDAAYVSPRDNNLWVSESTQIMDEMEASCISLNIYAGELQSI